MENPFKLFANEFEEVKGLLNEIKDITNSSAHDKFYNTEEAAKILKVEPTTVRDYIRKGKLKADKNGRIYRIRHSEIFGPGSDVKSLKFKR